MWALPYHPMSWIDSISLVMCGMAVAIIVRSWRHMSSIYLAKVIGRNLPMQQEKLTDRCSRWLPRTWGTLAGNSFPHFHIRPLYRLWDTSLAGFAEALEKIVNPEEISAVSDWSWSYHASLSNCKFDLTNIPYFRRNMKSEFAQNARGFAYRLCSIPERIFRFGLSDNNIVRGHMMPAFIACDWKI